MTKPLPCDPYNPVRVIELTNLCRFLSDMQYAGEWIELGNILKEIDTDNVQSVVGVALARYTFAGRKMFEQEWIEYVERLHTSFRARGVKDETLRGLR